MKYIRTIDDKGNEEIFTFPDTVNHDCMMESLSGIKNSTWGNWERVYREPVSAGFVTDGFCNGLSETLGLTSGGDRDTNLLNSQ